VSVHTITSRLQRARKRLQRDEELFVQKVLNGVQVSARLSQNIMREVGKIETASPPVSKPLLPWAAFGAAAVLIVLLLGTSNQYLARFQKPYSFEAQSEPTIEIIDTLVTLDTDSRPDVRNQIGQAVFPGKSSRTGLQTSETPLAATIGEDAAKFSTSRWTQASGPQQGPAYDIFATPEGMIYASTETGIYSLPTGATTWARANANLPTYKGRMLITAHRDTLYIVSTDEILASSHDGETWNAVCSRPKGRAVGLVITDAPQFTRSRTAITIYLVLRGKGIFQSTEGGTEWQLLNEGLTNKRIYGMAAIENTVFVGTNEGLYRLNAGVWQELSVGGSKTTQPFENPEDKTLANTDSGLYRFSSGIWEQVPVAFVNAIHSLVAFENNLYVGMGPDLSMWAKSKSDSGIIADIHSVRGRIFHSADLGDSWTEITPKTEPLFFTVSTDIKLLVAGETLLARGIERFRSTDAGQTWSTLGAASNLLSLDDQRSIAVNERTFYTVGTSGIYRTTDAGDSWHLFMDGIIGTSIWSLVAFNNRFYAYTGSEIVQSTDSDSWKRLSIGASKPVENMPPRVIYNAKLAVADGDLYAILTEKDKLRIFRLSTDGDVLVPVQGMPTFNPEMLSTELWAAIAETKKIHFPDNIGKNSKLTKAVRSMLTSARVGGFAVSDETFYVEYQRGLFKWEPGDTEWTDTGLIDDSEPLKGFDRGFKLAVSGDTVYVGKRDGKLFQSLDGGKSWKNITPTLPLHFTRFKQIVFAGTTVYVATDEGVLSSETGAHWQVLTDGMGALTVINKFAVHHTNLYGADDAGIYRLDTRGKWEQVSASVPDKIVSLAVSNDRLYIATQQRGIFHISLEAQL
jgi:photosystem II stability/assembly factor-like uncharacterized protein